MTTTIDAKRQSLLDAIASPGELAAMLYRLHFPRKSFTDLPASVQAAYCYDAVRLLSMLKAKEVTL